MVHGVCARVHVRVRVRAFVCVQGSVVQEADKGDVQDRQVDRKHGCFARACAEGVRDAAEFEGGDLRRPLDDLMSTTSTRASIRALCGAPHCSFSKGNIYT